MLQDYADRVSVISEEVKAAMRYRMGRCGDYRPLFVFVSAIDGGHTIGHEGQHEGMWQMARPITADMPYDRVWRHIADQLANAPLYAGGVR